MVRNSKENSVVVITGGSRGLGLEIARCYAQRNASLALCSRDQKDLDRAREILGREFPFANVFTRKCDVGDKEQVQRFLSAVNKRFGPINLLINNAGIIQVGPIQALASKDFEAALHSNLWGVINCCQAGLSQLIQTKGTILNVTSIGGVVPIPHLIPYATSKFGAVGFSVSLAAEMGRYGVHVTTVMPWLMRTGSYLKVLLKGREEKEFGWFSFGGNSPFTAINSKRAARAIVRACDKKKKFKVIGAYGKLARLMFALAPNTTINLMSGINRLLPAVPHDYSPSEPPRRGHEFRKQLSPLAFGKWGDKAAFKNNEWLQ